MNYEKIILRKKDELKYAQRRLECAVDDFNQFVFNPHFMGSEVELKMHITNWENHIKGLQAEIDLYSKKANQQSLDWGFE